MDQQPIEQQAAEYLQRVKTPLEHHQDMRAIVRHQLALARERSFAEPDDTKWSKVMLRLIDWLRRLEPDAPIPGQEGGNSKRH